MVAEGFLRRPLAPRDPNEAHRVASPLELFTDLCYVVGVSQAAAAMHHQVLDGRVLHGLVFFVIAFFAIWWAWLNFAWFNSAYANDDVVSRLLTLLQVFGSLVLAAGIPIVLGETVLSSTTAIQGAIHGDASRAALGSVVIGGVLIIFSAWWIYFAREAADILDLSGYQFVWGFGHYFIYASVALLGAALALRIDFYGHHSGVSGVTSSLLITVPVAVFLTTLWAVCVRIHDGSARTWSSFALTVVAVLASTWTPRPELVAGVLCALLLSVELRLASAGSVGATD